MRIANCFILTLPLLASHAAGQAPVFELESLVAPNAMNNDRLGFVIELDNDWLCAGVPDRFDTFSNAGIVATWPRTGSTLGVATQLSSPMPLSGGMFGVALALDGSELMVSERATAMFGSPLRGAVHRYTLQAGAWTYVDTVANPGGTLGNGFALAVGRDGDLLAVGAPAEIVQSAARGAVYLFRLVGGTWQSEGVLEASDGTPLARFGEAVAVSGERVIVGAHRQSNGGVLEGAAYAFEKIAGTWTETGRLAVDPQASDFAFGVSVDIDGTTAVVGAARTNDLGAAYIFEDTGSGWSQVERLQPAGLGNSATFGDSVRIQGDRIIIGAYQDTVVGNFSGSAWVYERSMGNWTPRVRLVGGTSAAFHGHAVALDGTGSYVVGAPVDTLPGGPSTSGALRFYRPDRPFGSPYCTPVPNSTQLTGEIAALGSDLAADDQVTLVAYHLPTNAFGYFLTSQAQGLVNQPGGSQGVLCLGGAIGRYVGPGQVGMTGPGRTFALELDLTSTPTPTGLVPVMAGETWNFQAWHRDSIGGQAVSNFTGAVSLTFL